MAQIPGKTGGGIGCQKCGCHAEYQADQGVEHQLKAVFPHGAHIPHLYAQIHNSGQYQGNLNLHVDLADHAQRA